MQDTNGNQIYARLPPGCGDNLDRLECPDQQIEDVRACYVSEKSF